MIAVLFLSAAVFAQSAPSPCPAGRPVDEIIAEIHKQQSKKNSRNKNPLPTEVCIFGWCPKLGRTPPTVPGPSPRTETPAANSSNQTTSDRVSSSRTAQDECLDAMDRAVDAAHNVEVGDYYFEQLKYKAAQLRYQDAIDEKPDDAAIHVRLGRAFEKLNDVPQAMEHYKSAEKLATPERWSQEAHAALARLATP